jgi:hypothetical protein
LKHSTLLMFPKFSNAFDSVDLGFEDQLDDVDLYDDKGSFSTVTWAREIN